MEMKLKLKSEDGAVEEEFDGRNAAFIVGGVLLAATFWASPSMGVLFALALLICAAVCAVVLLIAGAIGFCDSAVTRIWHRDEERSEGRMPSRMPSRAASA